MSADSPTLPFMTRRAHVLAATRDYVHYLEIGCREGRSLVSVLVEPKVTLAVVVDNWGYGAGGTGRSSPDHVIQRLGPQDARRVLFMSGDSHDVLPALRHTFDMIFVDGDHSEAGCLADLNAVLPLLDISGCIYVDDMDHPAHTYLRGAVLNWAVENALRHTIHEDGYGVMELRR